MSADLKHQNNPNNTVGFAGHCSDTSFKTLKTFGSGIFLKSQARSLVPGELIDHKIDAVALFHMAGLTKSLIQPSTRGKEDNNPEDLLRNIEHENKVACISNDKTTVKTYACLPGEIRQA